MNQYREGIDRNWGKQAEWGRSLKELCGCAATVQTQKYRKDLRHTHKLILAIKLDRNTQRRIEKNTEKLAL
jgi:hypothetical protein